MSDKGIRAVQLADLIRDYCATWIRRDFSYFVTVTQVTLSHDLKRATVWFTVYPDSDSSKVLRELSKSAHSYQQELKHKVKRHSVPFLGFSIDTSEKDSEFIGSLLK